jgi:hypothetical protein
MLEFLEKGKIGVGGGTNGASAEIEEGFSKELGQTKD